jgi:RHS repeat-associated protein
MNQPATQSSDLAGGVASRAVDGNTSGTWANGSVTHTNYEAGAWWQVDLGGMQAVQSVDVWNRTDCCVERLTNFNVMLLDSNQAIIASVNMSGQAGTPSTVPISGTARYVKVRLVGTDYLSLAEVKVWGASGGGSSSTQIQWLVADQLGTPRIIIDKTGALANVKRHDYLPFGEELTTQGLRSTTPGYSGDNVRQKFTLKERDIETGLDYSVNRYYSSVQGRFTAADPDNAGSQESDPQSWNGYAYVGNTPLTSTDPLGLWKEVDCTSGKGKCWESDNKNDTISSLAKILNVSSKDLNNHFQNPTIHIGDTFDASGFGLGNTPTIRDSGPAVVEVFLVSQPPSSADRFRQEVSAWEARRAARAKFWEDLIIPKCAREGRCQMGIFFPGGLANGLRGASPGLTELFANGSIRNTPIINIRNTLRQNGFSQAITRNKGGYLFRNAAGEEVRIMRRGGGWDLRIRNSNGNYLDEFGRVDQTGGGLSHGINVTSR